MLHVSENAEQAVARSGLPVTRLRIERIYSYRRALDKYPTTYKFHCLCGPSESSVGQWIVLHELASAHYPGIDPFDHVA